LLEVGVPKVAGARVPVNQRKSPPEAERRIRGRLAFAVRAANPTLKRRKFGRGDTDDTCSVLSPNKRIFSGKSAKNAFTPDKLCSGAFALEEVSPVSPEKAKLLLELERLGK
jgi:hypothetical protein